MLNLSFVRTFITLVDTGNFGETARKLCLSQPTVTQHIKKLEHSLGVSLVNRNNTNCTPTSKGLSLVPYAEALLASAERFEAAAGSRNLYIGCSGNIANYFIASDIKKYIDSQPDLNSWEVITATNPEIATQLAAGNIDIAFMEWPDERPEFIVRPWKSEPLVVIVPPQHPFYRRKKISREEFISLEFIGGEKGSGTGTLLQEMLGPKVDDLKIKKDLHNTEAVKSAVRSGLGCSIVLKKCIEDEAALGQLGVLEIKNSRLEKTFYIAHLARLPESSPAVKFAEFLLQG